MTTARIQQMEETVRNTQNPTERKNLEDALPQMNPAAAAKMTER